jgi:2-isopropylmalate synthase
MAVDSVKSLKDNLKNLQNTEIILEYSPESFSSAEIDYSLEVCNAVISEWQNKTKNQIIINLPETVECATPNVYADQIEYMSKKLINRENIILSVHTHNDRGTGNAAAELALLAGAQRVEGTLFGNGERTGNCDIVSMAINMMSDGIVTNLDFSNLLALRKEHTRLTSMEVPPRQPYAGDLVFTAFSGSHQDAIRKGLKARKLLSETDRWDVPYLCIDPRDIGRQYKELIRINSQSGKGGAVWVLETEYGIIIPKPMQKILGDTVSATADVLQRELSAQEIYRLFENKWLNTQNPVNILDVAQTHVDGSNINDNVLCRASVKFNGETFAIGAKGNGPLDAFASALKQIPGIPDFTVSDFHEHSIGTGSDTDAMAYVEITLTDGKKLWGCGRNPNIGRSAINAVTSAVNTVF